MLQEECGLLVSVIFFRNWGFLEIGGNKYSCKGVSPKHNDLHFESFEEVLDFFNKTALASELEGRDINKANNVGFRVYDQGMVIYEQNKFKLSTYYHKCYVLTDDNHTRPLEF